MNKTKAELLAEIDYLQEELRLAMKAGLLETNEALLADLAKIPRWVQWLFGVRQGD